MSGNRERSNSVVSVKDFIKRKREEQDTSEVEEVFRRSKITAKSPSKETKKVESETEMDELKHMMAGLAKNVENGIQENKRESKEIKEKLDSMEALWSGKMKEMEHVINQMSEKVGWQDDRIAALEEQLEKQERSKRANNIIIKNIPIEGYVTGEKVEEFLKEKMQIQVTVVEAFKIGKEKENRIVLAKLRDAAQKTIIMKSKRKLIGTKTYIENDLTKQERDIQDKIWTAAREARENGERVRVGYQRLYKQDELHVWDAKEGALKPRSGINHPSKN